MSVYWVATDDNVVATAGTEVAIVDCSHDNTHHYCRAKHKARCHVLVSSYNYGLYDHCDHSNCTHHNRSHAHISHVQVKKAWYFEYCPCPFESFELVKHTFYELFPHR